MAVKGCAEKLKQVSFTASPSNVTGAYIFYIVLSDMGLVVEDISLGRNGYVVLVIVIGFNVFLTREGLSL
jgi:hypothetical protein